jgi:ABC-type spermidine/putrescine transport system permease subunit I
VFLRVTLPLSLPGVVNGAALVFALTISNFITADFLGGGRVLMVGSMIHQLVSRTLNYPFAAAVALALLAAGAALALSLALARFVIGRAVGRAGAA